MADGPRDPFTSLAAAAVATAEQYQAFVKAGMPPNVVAIMLGQMLGAMAVGQQQDGQ